MARHLSVSRESTFLKSETPAQRARGLTQSLAANSGYQFPAARNISTGRSHCLARSSDTTITLEHVDQTGISRSEVELIDVLLCEGERLAEQDIIVVDLKLAKPASCHCRVTGLEVAVVERLRGIHSEIAEIHRVPKDHRRR